jgi:hypothetical protein
MIRAAVPWRRQGVHHETIQGKKRCSPSARSQICSTGLLATAEMMASPAILAQARRVVPKPPHGFEASAVTLGRDRDNMD